MKHITSLALLIACAISWVQSSAQSIVILDCIQDSFVLCAPNPGFSLPDNNQMIVGVGTPGATTCSGHVRLPLQISDTCGIIISYFVDLIPFDGNDTVRLQDTSEVFLNINDEATMILDSRLFGTSPISLNGIDYNEACPDETGGFHRLLWTVMDECDDVVICDFLLRIEDCVPPLVSAVGVSSVVMPSSNEVTIFAYDFILSAVDDCSPENWLLYSFDSLIFTPTMLITCATIAENGGPSFLFDLWTSDGGVDQDCNGSVDWNERNLTRTNTIVVIEDYVECEPELPFGRILSENQVPTEGVTVKFQQGAATFFTVQTDADGIYAPMFINPLLTYTVTPSKDGDDFEGVSTLDLIKIQKHLLGNEPFDSPFKYIAADANNSESVTALDLLELRKLILRIHLELPGDSWRFIHASFVYTDPNPPWPPYQESFILTTPDTVSHDFTAVKIGDLNGSVTQAQLHSSRDPITLEFKNHKLINGETVEIDFTSKNFQDVIGFQFTLQMPGLELLDIFPGKINITSDQFAKHKDAITCSWFDLSAISAKKSDVLFTLVVRVRTAGMLGDMLNMNSRLTKAESYIKAGNVEQVSDIILRVKDIAESNPEFVSNQSTALTLYQNEPNPFKSETSIPFSISESGQVSLRIFNALGREVYFSSRDFPAGRNAFRVNFSSMEQPGLMYYRVEKDGEVATRKMVFSGGSRD